MLQDWRLRGGYRYLGVMSVLRLYGKWRYSPEYPDWLLTSKKVPLSILKPLGFGNIGIVVEGNENRKLLRVCRRVNAPILGSLHHGSPTLSPAPTSMISPLPGDCEDVSTFFIHEQILSSHKNSRTENVMRMLRSRERDVIVTQLYGTWALASDDNILIWSHSLSIIAARYTVLRLQWSNSKAPSS